MIEFDVDMSYLLECDELDKVVLNDENGEHEPMEFVPKDAATVSNRSCASCPEMDNPDSYIRHLQSALKWHDEHVPRPINPRNTCVVLQGEKPPEEVLFVGPDGVTRYQPEDVTVSVEPDDVAMLKLHNRMNAELIKFERALGVEHVDGGVLVPFVARMHEIIDDAATVGAGTCRIEERYGNWYCTGCGEIVGTCDVTSELCIDGNAIDLWRHCPRCGRRIEADE